MRDDGFFRHGECSRREFEYRHQPLLPINDVIVRRPIIRYFLIEENRGRRILHQDCVDEIVFVALIPNTAPLIGRIEIPKLSLVQIAEPRNSLKILPSSLGWQCGCSPARDNTTSVVHPEGKGACLRTGLTYVARSRTGTAHRRTNHDRTTQPGVAVLLARLTNRGEVPRQRGGFVRASVGMTA